MGESNPKTLSQSLWNCADILRSKMDANEYKNYLLGLVFYKYLSDKLLLNVADLLEQPTDDLVEAQRIYEAAYKENADDPEFLDDIKFSVSYVVKPELTFTYLVERIYERDFQLANLEQGFVDIQSSNKTFANMFEDIDLFSKKLGSDLPKQSQTISEIMKELYKIDIVHDSDMLGDAYEYLLGEFASDTGKKAGEFYTPQAVSTLMTRIVLHGKENLEGFSVYDPTMGSGSLLLNAKKYSNHPRMINYFGQELNTSTYNLARMNMILHGVPAEHQHLHNADTLDEDWPVEEPTNFHAVLMNPPYSANWSAAKGFLDDPRFASYGVLAPKGKADFAFLLHGYYHLKDTGVMAIVLPHGVLFRGNAEEKIRRALLENGAIDTVIGLPANIFYNTSIPTTVIVLKKNRTNRDVLFIDASKEFTKEKRQNKLETEHIDKILDTYVKRETIDKYSYVATFEEIQENDFNLNIPRYVDTFEEEEPIDIVALSKEMIEINKEIEATEKEFLSMLDELQVTDETRDIIEATKAVFRR